MSVNSQCKQSHVSFILQIPRCVYVFTNGYDNHAQYTRTMNGSGNEHSTLLWSTASVWKNRLCWGSLGGRILIFSYLLAECFSWPYSAGIQGLSGASLSLAVAQPQLTSWRLGEVSFRFLDIGQQAWRCASLKPEQGRLFRVMSLTVSVLFAGGTRAESLLWGSSSAHRTHFRPYLVTCLLFSLLSFQ